MKLVRYIFRAKDYSLPKIELFSDKDKKKILTKLKEFVDDIVGVRLNSLDTLISAK